MKDMKKLTILMVAVVAIGVFSLPSVLSLGTGQHKFLNGSAVQCGKCHANAGDGVYRELQASTQNQYGPDGLLTNDVSRYAVSGGTIHNSSYFWERTGKYDCARCHEVTTGARTKTSGGHTGVKKEVVCTQCHAGEYGRAVGTIPVGTSTDAHKDFVLATGSLTGRGVNGTYACMGCHTAVRVAGSPSYTYDPGTLLDGLQIGGNWSIDYTTTSNPMTPAQIAIGSPP